MLFNATLYEIIALKRLFNLLRDENYIKKLSLQHRKESLALVLTVIAFYLLPCNLAQNIQITNHI